VDYANDIGYVGDDSGKLHKLTPLFNGPLAEVTDGGWPVIVSNTSTKILTGPVLDPVSNNIFLGDEEGTAGNLFYVRLAVDSQGTCSAGSNGGSPPCLGETTLTASNLQGLSDPPLVDSANGWIYAQTSNADGSNAKILQADTTLTTVSTATVGTASTNDLHAGDFDNTYYESGPRNPGARYYVCGLDGGGKSAIYQFGFDGVTGHLNSSPATSVVITAATQSPCSPLTATYNADTTGGAKDWLFVSVKNRDRGKADENQPVVFQIDITNAPSTLSITHAASYTFDQGTSGMIVDNVSPLSQTSNIYFVTLGARPCTTGGSGACATKLQQSDLR
jgi:hypothetical protein